MCGTGLSECILSGLLSQERTDNPYVEKKVLHIDRNSFYGGEGASVNLTNLYKIFKDGKEPPKELGHNRDWNIDLIPKYIMSGGKLVKILLKTRVSRYLEWKRTIFVIQLLMALTSSKIRKVDSSRRVALKSQKSQSLQKKPLHQIWWVCSKRGVSRNSLKAFKPSKKEIQKHTKVNNVTELRHWNEQTSQTYVLKIQSLTQHNWLRRPCNCLIYWWEIHGTPSCRSNKKNPTLCWLNGQIWKLTFHLPNLWSRRYPRRILKNQCSQRWNIHVKYWHWWDSFRER